MRDFRHTFVNVITFTQFRMSDGRAIKTETQEEEIAALKELNWKLEVELAKVNKSRRTLGDSKAKDVKEEVKELREYIVNCLKTLPVPLQTINQMSTDDLHDDIETIIKCARSDVTLLVGQIVGTHEDLNVLLFTYNRIQGNRSPSERAKLKSSRLKFM